MTASGTCPFTIDASGRDIHGEAAELRKRGRITEVELPGGVVTWWVTDQALTKQLLTDPRVSRDTYQHWPAWENGESELARTWPLAIWVADRNMISAYGDEHRRLRKLVAKAFTARRTAALRPRIEALTGELLERLGTWPADEAVDLRAEFAYPLPTQVISELLGIPDSIRDELLTSVRTMLRTDVSVEEARSNEERMYALLAELLVIKRAEPADDLTSGLISVRDDDGSSGLTEKELVDTILLMFTAGHETTVNLLDHAVHALLTHPEQLALLRSGEVPWEDAVEEVLRLEAPFASLPMRYAVEDIDLGDVVVRKGDPIIVSFAAAGRDPLVHGDTTDVFDVRRATRKEHVAFGHGAHHCLGAPLARLEASVGLPALFARFPQMALARPAEEITPLASFISNGHEELPVLLGRPQSG
ncbi:cytochrome P450 [Streptomyces sp. TRM 70351]|uniref:cytochrome P450 family protein n=1 Tax=Streptomyces sp. TRM 70351 TaxID=3116552 RepID=UPI002E7B8134|nr:cytochrome P450 [Streptomyces sp. TRM 70351]MEE1929755.1 cytochrome P450 [Streptomyces sp. TRM 70351]